MFRSTRISLLRSLAATGMLAAAVMMAPAGAKAQTLGDAALLNRLAPPTYVSSALALVWNGGPRSASSAVDGEVALLARTTTALGYPRFAREGVEAAPVSGAYALLGRREPLEPTLWEAVQR